MFKRLVFAILALIKLREDEVPNLQKSVAITAGRTSIFAATALLAQVNINFTVGAARSGANLPEIIIKSNDMRGIKSGLLEPNLLRLIIVGINRHPKFFSWQAANFR